MDHAYNHEDTVLSAEMNRREFLRLCALGTALPGLLAACQIGPSGLGNATPNPTKRPSPTIQPSPSDADWSALARSLQGTLVRPDSPQYPTARLLYSPRFDNIRPAAIAYCASPTDVQTCLSFVRRFGLPLAPRSGGHSYVGYSTSTGLVLDVTRMNTVNMDAGSGVAKIGAGALLIDVYAALAQYGLALPAGSCSTVGIAGLTLGGGLGVLGRKFGLTSDNLLAAQAVVADGRLLTCDTSHDPDLFWALRGGGGGNFGVVTSFTFQTHPVSTLSQFTLDWPWSHASEVVNAWQTWVPQTPDELWSNCLLFAPSDKSSGPIIRANGVYVGDVTSLNVQLEQLSSRINAELTHNYVSNAGLLETMLIEANCYGQTVSQCRLPTQNPQGQLQRIPYASKSDFFTNPLPRQGIDAMVSAINSRQASTLGEGIIELDAYGGAINRVATEATAFVHRNTLFSTQYIANWNVGDSTAVVSANHSWLTDTWQAMRPYASGTSYQNYIDPDLTDWLEAYYGANLPRLQRIKAAYDPGDLFHFAQSIPLAT